MEAAAIKTDPVLIRIRSDLDALYGERIERVVLYGSRARGDSRSDSDYDIAVFLKDLHDPDARWKEGKRIARTLWPLLNSHEALIHAMPFRAGSYVDRTMLMHEIRREGVDL